MSVSTTQPPDPAPVPAPAVTWALDGVNKTIIVTWKDLRDGAPSNDALYKQIASALRRTCTDDAGYTYPCWFDSVQSVIDDVKIVNGHAEIASFKVRLRPDDTQPTIFQRDQIKREMVAPTQKQWLKFILTTLFPRVLIAKNTLQSKELTLELEGKLRACLNEAGLEVIGLDIIGDGYCLSTYSLLSRLSDPAFAPAPTIAPAAVAATAVVDVVPPTAVAAVATTAAAAAAAAAAPVEVKRTKYCEEVYDRIKAGPKHCQTCKASLGKARRLCDHHVAKFWPASEVYLRQLLVDHQITIPQIPNYRWVCDQSPSCSFGCPCNVDWANTGYRRLAQHVKQMTVRGQADAGLEHAVASIPNAPPPVPAGTPIPPPTDAEIAAAVAFALSTVPAAPIPKKQSKDRSTAETGAPPPPHPPKKKQKVSFRTARIKMARYNNPPSPRSGDDDEEEEVASSSPDPGVDDWTKCRRCKRNIAGRPTHLRCEDFCSYSCRDKHKKAKEEEKISVTKKEVTLPPPPSSSSSSSSAAAAAAVATTAAAATAAATPSARDPPKPNPKKGKHPRTETDNDDDDDGGDDSESYPEKEGYEWVADDSDEGGIA